MVAKYNSTEGVYLGVWPVPGANEIDVAKRLRDEMERIRPTLPKDIDMRLVWDGTMFMRNALTEITKTLSETILIVALVVFLFMGSVRTALVPLVAMPVSLIGAALFMFAFGFSLNLLTLLAIVLSVGLVVDDAIVVVENVERHVRQGKSRIEAALAGARELIGPIIAMTITLAAVYTPIGFQGGLTGSLFLEFAITLAVAVVLSGVVAVTLSPVMSSRFVHRQGKEGRMTLLVNRTFELVRRGYARLLDGALEMRWGIVASAVLIMGLLSVQFLPVAQFPEITPPVVQIDADYPGASAEVVAESVARAIEVQLPGIDNLVYFDSTSSNDGHVTIKLTFEIGTDPDIAQVQTQNREKLAEPQLPPEVIRQGVSVKKMSPDLVGVIALKSTDPNHDAVFLSNYAILRLVDNVRRVKGVGDAMVFGQQNYSMRIILNPLMMARLSLTPTDIAAIIREQNRDYPAGLIGREPAMKGTELTIPVITKGRLTDVKDFEELIVRALPDGSLVRLKDVARIELGAQSYALEGRWNSRPTTFIVTFLAPGANALDTVRATRAVMTGSRRLHLVSVVQLYKALGGGWSPEIAENPEKSEKPEKKDS